MICGINFGYSKEDEVKEALGVQQPIESPSFFSDSTVNRTDFAHEIRKWLNLWDIDLAQEPGEEGPLEKSFFQTNWDNSQTRSTDSDFKINTSYLVENSAGFLSLLEERKPRLVIFVGVLLIEALNDIRIRERVESILGERPGNALSITGDAPPGKRKFKIMLQKFPKAQIISLPHPQARGLRDEYMKSFRDVVKPLILKGDIPTRA